MRKVLVLLLAVAVLLPSCTMHKEAAAKRRNARQTRVWHGWSKDECPQAYREP